MARRSKNDRVERAGEEANSVDRRREEEATHGFIEEKVKVLGPIYRGDVKAGVHGERHYSSVDFFLVENLSIRRRRLGTI